MDEEDAQGAIHQVLQPQDQPFQQRYIPLTLFLPVPQLQPPPQLLPYAPLPLNQHLEPLSQLTYNPPLQIPQNNQAYYPTSYPPPINVPLPNTSITPPTNIVFSPHTSESIIQSKKHQILTLKKTDNDLKKSLFFCKIAPKPAATIANNFTKLIDEPKPEVVHRCNLCPKEYSTRSNLLRHRNVHRTLSDAEKCPVCDSVYVSKSALSVHVLTHNKQFTCDICDRVFSRLWLLQGHLRYHFDLKPLRCEYCKKRFRDRSNLRVHIQTHLKPVT